MLTRRRFCAFLPLALLATQAADVEADDLVQIVGRLPEPSKVRRVFAAGPVAAVLSCVLAPEQLLGWPQHMDPEALHYLGKGLARLPRLGRLAGRASTVSLETLMSLRPDLVLDVGSTGPSYRSQATRVAAQTGLCYVLVSGRLVDSAQQLRAVGRLLGVAQRGEELARRANELLEQSRSRLLAQKITVYLARGADGLETGMQGSLNTEVLEHLGLNVLAQPTGQRGIGRVSREQLLSWKPDLIVTQEPGLAARLCNNSGWRSILKGSRLLEAPAVPFGWLDSPPGVNRLLGLLWLVEILGSSQRARTQSTAAIDLWFRSLYQTSPQPSDLRKWLS